MSIGKRLKQERERLGMTQEQFANACGVRRRAQSTYENDERSPDSNYLESASSIGVDVAYVLTERGRDQLLRASLNEEFRDFGRAFASILGISETDILQSSELVESRMKEHHAALERSGLVNFGKWRIALEAEYLKVAAPLVDNSPLIRELAGNQLDTAVLAGVIEQVEALLPDDVSVPASKKAGVIAMLCRASTSSGKIDESMVREAVKLVFG
ncbi:MAG: helix-turn-helix transcriptional regulator [Betaproteobacteria bacterium]|nr:helix-turn-helix transcriptional regulator [Betaproteobacteria bacterium]